MKSRIGRGKARIAAVLAGTAAAGTLALGGAGLASAEQPATMPTTQEASTLMQAPEYTPKPGETVRILGPDVPHHEHAHPAQQQSNNLSAG